MKKQINAIIDKLALLQYFAKLDLTSGFLQIDILDSRDDQIRVSMHLFF